MRLAWIVPGEITQPTGGYIYDRLIVSGLRGRGHTVDVFDAEPDLADARRLLTFDAAVGDALCSRELAPAFEAVRGSTERVLLVHHPGSWEVERHDRQEMRAIEDRAMAACDRIIVTSRETATRLAAAYPGRVIDIVLPGADRLRRPVRQIGRADGCIRILFVGSLIPRKRIPLLLDALERIDDPGLSLRLVGDPGRDPEHARSLQARVSSSAALVGRVTFSGIADDEALSGAFAAADLVVLPSSLEGYGMAVTEALAAGAPVLVSRQAARAAGVAEHGAVLVFDEDPNGLADALSRFAADASLRARLLAEAARPSTWPRWAEAVAGFEALLMGWANAGEGSLPSHGPSR